MTAPIETLDSRIVHADRWMRVRLDRIRRASGAEGQYTVVEKADFAVIAAIEDGSIHLVRQFRYPAQASYWELPQGSHDAPGSPDAAAVARQELREETGLVADEIRKIGVFFTAYGYSNQRCHLFLASGLTSVGQALEPEEEGLETRAFALADVAAMIRSGAIVDATTIAAHGLLSLHGLV
jgi:ADP-ribose pyrophosphatase